LLLIDPQLPSRLLRAHFDLVQWLGSRRNYSDERKLALFALGHKVLFRIREEWNASLGHNARSLIKAARKLLRRTHAKNIAPSAVDGIQKRDFFNDDEQRILAGFHWILSGYTPPPYQGPVTMFVTDEQRMLTPFIERRWKRIAPQIRIERIAGMHLDSITKNIDELAAKVREHLAVTE
jgi:hypothetical protein